MSILLAAFGKSDNSGPILQGTSVSPVVGDDTANQPADARCYWDFQADGELWLRREDGVDVQQAHWCRTPVISYWIDWINDGGQDPDVGDALTTWHAMTVDRTVGWEYLADSAGQRAGQVRVRIATDSGGSDIVATGYYDGIALVTDI